MPLEAVTALLGPGYEILNRKVVCGVPADAVPAWLRQRILGNPVNNLGAYVKPQYRDVTYFYGIDFHQDLIDYQAREADFITLYIYLHPVTRADAPLYLLEGSHALGGSVFPHDLTRTTEDAWRYRNGAYGETTSRQRILTGDPKRPHYGDDLAAPVGTPIHAPAPGLVCFAETGLPSLNPEIVREMRPELLEDGAGPASLPAESEGEEARGEGFCVERPDLQGESFCIDRPNLQRSASLDLLESQGVEI